MILMIGFAMVEVPIVEFAMVESAMVSVIYVCSSLVVISVGGSGGRRTRRCGGRRTRRCGGRRTRRRGGRRFMSRVGADNGFDALAIDQDSVNAVQELRDCRMAAAPCQRKVNVLMMQVDLEHY